MTVTKMTAAVSLVEDSVALHVQGKRRNFLWELVVEEAHPYRPQYYFEKNLGLQEKEQVLQ
jgi:hypothetical protein